MRTAIFSDTAKLEMEDSLEDQYGPLYKRSKSSLPSHELSTPNNGFSVPPSQYNPLDEPSPLGLRLRKSPSLLDLIQMRLSQGNASLGTVPNENLTSADKKDVKGASATGANDKLKASNFPALLLRIGGWEYVSRYEGDLVAKCYFAKHKLVWEILDGGLKSKIEIQWSDIMALKANCPDDGPESLTVVLARQPLFFRETNPQPRKHTLWQATTDFTDGQASTHRQHYLQCSPEVLNKHYEKLIQCDTHLNFISRKPDMVMDSPYFEPRGCVVVNSDGSKIHGFQQADTADGSSSSGFHDLGSTSTEQSCSFKIEEQNSLGMTLEHLSPEAPSPSSVMDLHAIEGKVSHGEGSVKALPDWDKLKELGIHPSMSITDLVNHIGHRISERRASANSLNSEKELECGDMLENIAQILMSDTQSTTASDEKTLMSRINSFCCLLQDPAMVSDSEELGSRYDAFNDGENGHQRTSDSLQEGKVSKQPPAMSRKDSLGDLLSNLPRIASLQKFLFDISTDDDDNAG